jgi:PhnB protein
MGRSDLMFIPYLFFSGDCEKAFAFYTKALGGKISARLTYGESPMACGSPPKWDRKLAHICLEAGGMKLMGADAPPGTQQPMQGFAVNFVVKTPARAKKVFAALMKGGKVCMPMEKTFFARAFGMGVDRFGAPWMVICPNKQEMKA